AKNQTQLNAFDTLTDKIIVLLIGNNSAEGNSIDGISDIQYKQLESGTSQVIHNMTNIQLTEYILSLIAIIVSVTVAYLTTRSILRHINLFRQHSSRIASGDLRQHILLETNDEIGQLGKDLNTMTDSLSSVTKLITEACHNMVST